MSHFTVLVAVPQGKTLEDVMLPYHEYECTGIEKYLEWVDDIHDKNLQAYNTETIPVVVHLIDSTHQQIIGTKYDSANPIIQSMWKREGWGISSEDEFILLDGYILVDMPKNEYFKTFNEYMEKWCGYTEINPATGKYERLTNPNAKWDWYQVGGRWKNEVIIGDQIKVKDWDYKLAQQVKYHRKLGNRIQWKQALKTVSTENFSDEIRQRISNWMNHNPDVQEFFGGDVERVMRENAAFDKIGWHLSSLDDHKDMNLSDQEFKNKFTWAALSHAFIDEQGKWHERGSMGWWGMCSGENTDTFDGENGEFWTFIRSLNPETMLYAVDCHI